MPDRPALRLVAGNLRQYQLCCLAQVLGQQFGGGVAFPLTERLMGVGQFDYRRIFFEGGGSNSIRFVAGVRVALR